MRGLPEPCGLAQLNMSDTTLVIGPTVLPGRHVRLEPLAHTHIPGLVAAAREDPELYRWSSIPQGVMEMAQYVDSALSWREEGSALPFATVRTEDDTVIGSTRFFLLERWGWPAGHPDARRDGFDGCEIGYTWLAASAIRTPANTESKLLMLTRVRDLGRAPRMLSHRRTQRAFTGGPRAHWRAVRRGAARAPPGHGSGAARFGALFHHCRGMAAGEATPAAAARCAQLTGSRG